MKQLTKGQAIKLAESGVWKEWTDGEVVKFQLFQDCLCMDWSRFHEAMEKVLGRSIFTHEFASSNVIKLKAEYNRKHSPPTFEEIMNFIPEDKRVLISSPPTDVEEGENEG